MGAGAGAGFGAAGFLGAAAFFGAATRAFAFLADFFATARFAFLRAGAAFFALLPFLVFDFAFFAFLAIINSRRCGSDFGTYSTLYSHLATTVSPAAAVTFFPGERLRRASPRCPVDQLDAMDDRKRRARCDLRHAADISGCNHIGLDLFDIRDFAFAQPLCELRLKNVVGASRTAT